MANSGGLPAGGSVLTLSTKVSKGIGLGPSRQRPGWRPFVALMERKMGAGALHTQSLRRVKTGELARVEARDQEDLWCPCPYAFAFPSPNSETFCYFLSLPHLQCSPCPTIGQYSVFLTFIIKKFKHRKNGKNCTLNMSLPFRFYN